MWVFCKRDCQSVHFSQNFLGSEMKSLVWKKTIMPPPLLPKIYHHFICNFIWNFYTFLFTYIFCLVIFKAKIMSGIDELYRHLPRLSLISDVFFLEQRGLMNIKQKIPELILFKLFSLANARNWTFILKAKITYLIESEGLVSFTIQKVKFKNYSFIL